MMICFRWPPFVALMALLVFPSCGEAGLSYRRGQEYVALQGNAEPVSNAFVIVDGEERVYSLRIDGQSRTSSGQLAKLIEGRDALVAELSKIEGYLGTVNSDARPQVNSAKAAKVATESKTIALHARFALPKDTLVLTQKVTEVVSKFAEKEIEGVIVFLDQADTVLLNPEKHRAEVVAKAMETLAGLKVAAPHFVYKVSGLEKPLVVGGHGESQFVVSLPYTFTAELSSE